MQANIQPFKEPRGFIKLLQWLFAICAFATTVDYSGRYGFTLTCKDSTTAQSTTSQAFMIAEYPFDMNHQSFTYTPAPNCPKQPDLGPVGNAKSEAVFYVFTGVISFLYATGMIGVYLLADKIYTENRKFPLIDFCITVMLAVFWIAGASAWANGVSTVSSAIDIEADFVKKPTCTLNFVCNGFFHASVSKLVVSVLFGFINFILWSGNIWFLYKETAVVFNGATFGSGAQSSATTGGGDTA